jgi:hypothetical protein
MLRKLDMIMLHYYGISHAAPRTYSIPSNLETRELEISNKIEKFCVADCRDKKDDYFICCGEEIQ